MAEALKTFFNIPLVERLADALARVHPAFRRAAFVESASRGLDDLELLDRGKHIARCLAEALPQGYPEALAVILKSLGPEHATDELVGVGMAPFFYLPHTLFVAERGLDHFELSMHAQYELTKRFTAESSIRAYIARDPERAFDFLLRWANDPNPHVRRLSSEGTRLRLPWASRVRWLDAHPDRVLEVLEVLKDDPASVVRRSVANNLNDLGKVHPELLFTTCERWLVGASSERRSLVEHALRSAVKRAEPQALRLLGFGAKPAVVLRNVQIKPKRVPFGGRVKITFELVSSARRPQDILCDLVIHYVKASGASAPKVFKLKRVKLPPAGVSALSASVSLAEMTTRRHYPGKHRVGVLVNGAELEVGAFTLLSK